MNPKHEALKKIIDLTIIFNLETSFYFTNLFKLPLILIIPIIMATFPERLILASKVKSPYVITAGLGIFFAGSALGYYKAKWQADIENENYS